MSTFFAFLRLACLIDSCQEKARNSNQNRFICSFEPCGSVAVKMANCVKIKMNEKVMRLRSSTLTVGNLAMIFKLDINQGIYICCEEEGEIIIPTEKGFFNIEDYAKTYVVNGEPTRPASSRTSAELSSPCNSLGIPLSYQRTASMRTNLNPPPGQMSSTQTLQRPRFSSGSRKVNLVPRVSLLRQGRQRRETLGTRLEKSATIIIEEVGCSGGRPIIWRNKREISSLSEFDRRNRVGG